MPCPTATLWPRNCYQKEVYTLGQAWLIASGKGGVGKSTIAAGLGQALSRLGKRVCIVDTDIGLRDQDLILGLQNSIVYDLIDVCEKKCRTDQAILPADGFEGLYLLPAAQFARSRDLDPKAFRKLMQMLRLDYDFVLIDCPAGIEKGLRTLLKSECGHAIVVVTPDDVCIRNAERVIDLMRSHTNLTQHLIINRLVPELIRMGEMYPASVVSQTLDVPLLGELPEDPAVLRALLNHVPLADCGCDAYDALQRIARRMTGEDIALPQIGSKKPGLFRRFIDFLQRED